MADGTVGLPASARVVIVGGGVMGCGLAYHLAHEGWSEIVLVEKAELTSGSTWHAAGQITRSTTSIGLGRCIDYNIRLYSGTLEKETGLSVGWHGCGSLRLAYVQDEMDWLRQTISVGRALGFDADIIGPDAIAELHPFYRLEGVLGALHTPDDGHVDPSGVTQALAAGARALGAKIVRRCRAVDIQRSKSGCWQVVTTAGTVACEHVVNAGGTYARQVGDFSGLQLPAVSMTHHYFVTDPVPEFAALGRELPVVRDDRKISGYVRMEGASGLVGIYEKSNPRSVWDDDCPWEAENELFTPDYDRVMPWLSCAFERVPLLAERGIRRAVHGAISHPPDGNPLIGPAPSAPNYWCCCGTQIGIGWGPGLTRELARWMVHGSADISMREFDPRRFGTHATRDWQLIKAREDYCLRHEIPYPGYNRKAGRPIRNSPLDARLRDRGAVFEQVCGHERPRWFARFGIAQEDRYSFRRNELHRLVGHECRAVRDHAGIMDISAFANVAVTGTDAECFLDRMTPNRLPPADGRISLAFFLNRRGRIEFEATIVRMGCNSYFLTAAAFFEQRLLDHLSFAARPGEDVRIQNLSDAWGALAVNGPESRAVLGSCTTTPLDDSGFPWFSGRRIELAGVPAWALRMSFAGELGWEIHCERDRLADIYHALQAANPHRDVVDYGSFAMNSMRMEKAYPGAAELTNEVTLREAGVLGRARLDKDFRGKAATCRNIEAPPAWTLAYLDIDTDGVTDGHGGEAVLLDGAAVGATTSVAHGHRVGRTLAFAYVEPRAAAHGTALEVIVGGEARPARVLGEAAYDPAGLLPRADTGRV